MIYARTTFELELVPIPPDVSEVAVIPVGPDGLCDIGDPAPSPADPLKTFHDLKAGDQVSINGRLRKVMTIEKLE